MGAQARGMARQDCRPGVVSALPAGLSYGSEDKELFLPVLLPISSLAVSPYPSLVTAAAFHTTTAAAPPSPWSPGARTCMMACPRCCTLATSSPVSQPGSSSMSWTGRPRTRACRASGNCAAEWLPHTCGRARWLLLLPVLMMHSQSATLRSWPQRMGAAGPDAGIWVHCREEGGISSQPPRAHSPPHR